MAGSIDVSPGISLTPSSTQQTLATNYITDFDYVTQYLPETDKDEFSRYGNRTINGFLRNVGSAEIPFASAVVNVIVITSAVATPPIAVNTTVTFVGVVIK